MGTLDERAMKSSDINLNDTDPNSKKAKNSPQTKKKEVKKKFNCIGTPDYIAPEVLKGEEHTFRLDWWSLGVIVYEFLTGGLPFNDQTPELIFKNIMARKISYPPIGTEDGMISAEAKSFIEELLVMDPYKRLGSRGV